MRVRTILFLTAVIFLIPKTNVYGADHHKSRSYVNEQIRDTFVHQQMQRDQIEMEAAAAANTADDLQEQPYDSVIPLPYKDGHIRDVHPSEFGEQAASFDHPQFGTKVIDPDKDIQAKIAQKQIEKRTTENFYKAVNDQFVDNIKAAGVKTPNVDISKELEREEQKANAGHGNF